MLQKIRIIIIRILIYNARTRFVMAFIKTRKKLVSSAIASTLSVVAVNAVAQDQIAQLETIHTEAAAEQSLKVDKSANSILYMKVLRLLYMVNLRALSAPFLMI